MDYAIKHKLMDIDSNKVQIFINNDSIRVNPYVSVFGLKLELAIIHNIKTDDFYLQYNGHILNDSKCLKEYGIQNNARITMEYRLKGGKRGGFNKFLIYFLSILGILLFLGIFISGILPMIGKVYAYLFSSVMKSIFQFIANITGTAKNGWVESATKVIDIIGFLLKYVIVYYFTYISIALTTFPFYYMWKGKVCKASYRSKRVAFVTSLAFIIIYSLFMIPNFMFSVLTLLTKTFPLVFKAVFNPLLKSVQSFTGIGKFFLVYIIPILGQLISAYHIIVNGVLALFTITLNVITEFDCNDRKKIDQLYYVIKNFKHYPIFKRTVKNYNLETLFKILLPGLKYWGNDEGLEKYVNDPAHEMSGTFSNLNYLGIKMITTAICNFFTFTKDFNNMYEQLGGEFAIGNTINTANVAGTFSSGIFIIAFIWYIFF